ncbi:MULTISPECIES: hypothetical protein [Streptomyces]|uniref:hypothetical protein n=1 Tax=Streptomyces TaxID=1883 RepID=UPI001E28B64B|nr:MULTISPECIES: hypothetical protein [Streptomyces]UFQ18573.1 hypothetical protein J2N69_28300 [Streptomyces huasconensis]WCL88188.1 hypothetical protein PPN52_28285 [Streptomyces sp. JCM 35825]
MKHHGEAETARKTAPRRPRHARPHRAPSATSLGTATAFALLLTCATAAPGHAAPMATATATAVTGTFASADTPGPGVVAPVIIRPADGSTVQVGRRNPRINFAGTGEPGATLALQYRKAHTASWKTLTSFTGLVGPDRKWAVTSLFPDGELTDGSFGFRVIQQTDQRERTSAPITLTIHFGIQPAQFTTPREGVSLSKAFFLDFGGIGEPGARISLSYGPDRTPMALRESPRVGADGTWAATAEKDSVPAGTHDIYVSEDAAPGQEDKRTITFITDRNASQLQWNVKNTTSRVRAGGTMRLYGWTNSSDPVGDVAVQLTTQGRRFPLGTFATKSSRGGKDSALFDASGVPVPVGVPGGMANLVLTDPRNPDNFDSIPVQVLPSIPLKLSMVAHNGDRGRYFKGTGQPDGKLQFKKADGTWAATSSSTRPDSAGVIDDYYVWASKWKPAWDWPHLTAHQVYPNGESGPELPVAIDLPAPEVSTVSESGPKVVIKGTTIGDDDSKGTVQVQGADGAWFDAGGISKYGSFNVSVDTVRLGDTFKVRFVDDWTKRPTPPSAELRYRTPLKLKLTAENGSKNRTLAGSGQSGTAIQFRKPDGSWVTAPDTTAPSDDGTVKDGYRYAKWKPSWDWRNLTARQLYPNGDTGPAVDVPVAFPTPEISKVARTKKDVTVTGTTLGDEDGKGRMQVLGADGTWFDQAGYSGSGSFTLHVDPAKLGTTFAVRFVDDWTGKATPASPAQHTPAPAQAPTPDPARSPQSAQGSDSTPAPEPTRGAQPTQAPSPAPAQTPSPTPTQATADDKR